MNGPEVMLRLKAWGAGRPLARGETKHVPIAPDRDARVLAFVKMGGESAPWGIAWGSPAGAPAPKLWSVPEARNRDAVAAMCTAFGRELCAFLLESRFVKTGWGDGPIPFPQVWLPNPTHLEMLHFVALRYWSKAPGEVGDDAALKTTGRAATWLFREGQRPGTPAVLVATDVLREAFEFPAEEARQGHLGFLLAWLTTPGGREERLAAAAEAESSPIATAMDPRMEEKKLFPLVKEWNEGAPGGKEEAAASIRVVLEKELLRRWGLAARAVAEMRADPRRENRGLAVLVRSARGALKSAFVDVEAGLRSGKPVFVPGPETEPTASSAAEEYFRRSAAADEAFSALVGDDGEMQLEAIGVGDALRGRVVEIRPAGASSGHAPTWVFVTPGQAPTRVREESELCDVSLPTRKGVVRLVEPTSGGDTRWEIEMLDLGKSGKEGAVASAGAADRRVVGTEVTLVRTSDPWLALLPIRRLVEAKAGAGAWLTHGTAGENARKREADGVDGVGGVDGGEVGDLDD